MPQKLLTIAAWTLLVLIASATVSPIRDRPVLYTSASLEHLAAFAVIGVLFCVAYPRHIALVCLIVLGSAVLLELAQLLTADRHGRVQDALEKMAGGALGIMVGRMFIHFNPTDFVLLRKRLTIVRRDRSSPAKPNERP